MALYGESEDTSLARRYLIIGMTNLLCVISPTTLTASGGTHLDLFWSNMVCNRLEIMGSHQKINRL
jgi:hypothetical protein